MFKIRIRSIFKNSNAGNLNARFYSIDKIMIIVSIPLGRLGNAIFRYMASVVMISVYGGIIVNYNEEDNNNYPLLNDTLFVEWMNAHLSGKTLDFSNNESIALHGFYQHDTLYLKYRQQIINYIKSHPDDIIVTDGKTPRRQDFDYYPQMYKAINILEHPVGLINTYDTVVHLRLEDFIQNNMVIHPASMKILLDSIGHPSYCIILNAPTSELELRYIEYLHANFNISIESNDIITDYHIMKNAKTLVCSCSTISWLAAFFSETIQQVYMPNYPSRFLHETFRKPINNTVLYEYKTCSKSELEAFLRTAV